MAKITITPLKPDENKVISIKTAKYIRKSKLWFRLFLLSGCINLCFIVYLILTTINRIL